MPKTPQKKKIFHMESRLSIIFILNYQRKCGSKVENALMVHLINCIILPKNFTLNLKKKPLKICGKMAKNTIFNPKIAIFFILRHYLELKGDKNEIQFFPGDF